MDNSNSALKNMDGDKDKKFGSFEVGDTGVKFEDTGWRAVRYYKESLTPKIIQWVAKYTGLSEIQAGYVLLGLALIAIVVSLFLFFSGGETRPSISPNDLRLTPPSGVIPN